MSEPLLWNTLDEAAEWLSEETNEKWNPRRIMSVSVENYRNENSEKRKKHRFCYSEDGKRIIRNSHFSKEYLEITHLPPSPTYLSVQIPKHIKIGLYQYAEDVPEKRRSNYTVIPGNLARIADVTVRFVDLYPRNIGDIFLDSKAIIRLASVKYTQNIGWEYALFEPIRELSQTEIMRLKCLTVSHHGYLLFDDIVSLGGEFLITADMLRIYKEQLKQLLSDYVASHKKPGNESKIEAIEEYSTKELKLIGEAIEKFWQNHDPNRPPKKEEVVGWLTDKHGISKRVAEVMDTIMRSPEARVGGNKSR